MESLFVNEGINTDETHSGNASTIPYAQKIKQILTDKFLLNSKMTVANIGCGRDLIARIFVEHGNDVICVERNDEFVDRTKRLLSGFNNVQFINGNTQNTGLERNSVSMITIGHAFIGVDQQKTRNEFRRILKAPNLVAMIWNDVDLRDGFSNEYERICRKYCKDYLASGSDVLTNEQITEFFSWSFDYNQFSSELSMTSGELARMQESMPYSLGQENAGHDPMMKELQDAFMTYEKDASVTLKFVTRMYVGRIT
ncbi:Methyltransferase domain protein [Thermoplasmatales archaeon]|nr:Methyltransferase domain protein [Thermoplasmatales archaeon]